MPQNPCVSDYRSQKPLGDLIGDLHAAALHKITFHRVHHDIGAAAGSLIIRQCHGQLRIQDGKHRPAEIAVATSLDPSLFFRDHGGITHFTPGRRNGQDHADLQTACHLSFTIIKVPDISAVCHAVTDRLGRIDCASATDRQNKIDLFFLTKLNSFINQAEPRVRHRSAQCKIRDACLIQDPAHPFQKAGTDNAAAPVMNQDFFPSELLNEFCHPLFCFLPENHSGWCVIPKVSHTPSFKPPP